MNARACTIELEVVMYRIFYRILVATTIVVPMTLCLLAGELQTIKLKEPSKQRGLPFMEALWVKASALEWSDKELSLQDLSDLVWAANGINRPAEKKSTASSAQNARDVDLYAFMKEGVYLYNTEKHELDPVLSGDFRSQIMMARPPRPGGPPRSDSLAPRPPMPPQSNPPIQIILVSDADRFRMGPQDLRYEWGAIDVGIVSQNISLFCAATGLKTRPRASMDKEKIKTLLKLKDTQHVFLNHPVGYAK
jgi:nitroreductase